MSILYPFGRLRDRVSRNEVNTGLLALKTAIDRGWTVFHMAGGFADEFQDETGIAPGAFGSSLIPAMTDLTVPSGEVTASSSNLPTYPAWRAFTGGSSGWQDGWYAGGVAPQWLQYSFGPGNAEAVDRLVLTNLDQAGIAQSPVDFVLEGSNDGVSFDNLLSVVGNTVTAAAVEHGYDILPSVAYRDFRLTITAHSAGNTPNRPALGNMALHRRAAGVAGSWGVTYDASGDFYSLAGAGSELVSAAFDPGFQPAAGRAVMLVNPADGAALNVDYVAEISRDGGVSWSPAALTKEADFSADIEVWATGEADLAAQPAGQDFRVRLRAPNGAAADVHAWYGQAR